MAEVAGILKSKVFLGCIPATAEEAEVRQTVTQLGKVIGFFYLRDVQNSDRGFALVTFTSETEARAAVAALNGQTPFANAIRGVHAKLTCEKFTSDLTHTVFFDTGKSLPSANWEQYMSEEGHPYYHNKATGETVWEKPEFFTPAALVQTPVNMELITGTSTSGPALHLNSGYGPLGANLFIFHIPADWKDEELRAKFEVHGQLVSCKISTEDNGRSRGFGFISYTTREAAANAIHHLNGIPAGGKYLKVTVKQGEEEYAVEPSGGHASGPASYLQVQANLRPG